MTVISSTSFKANKARSGVGGSKSSSSSVLSYCASSLLPRILLIALGIVVLFQTEKQAYNNILEDTNVAIAQATPTGGVADSSGGGGGVGTSSKRMMQPSFSACLVLQNEHEIQYLTEWIAYHYHVLPLRRLIVFKDPLIPRKSTSSINDILNRWTNTGNNKRVNITLWDHTDYIYPPGHPYHKLKRKQRQQHNNRKGGMDDDLYDYEQNPNTQMTHHDKLRQRNTRQDIFWGACLRRLKREGGGTTWVVMSHADEFTLINPRLRNVTDPLHTKASIITIDDPQINPPSRMNDHGHTNNGEEPEEEEATTPGSTTSTTIQLTIPSQKESGSVLKWLHRTQQYSYAMNPQFNNILLSQPCIPLTTKTFGTKELVDIENRTFVTNLLGNTTSTGSSNTPPNISYSDFLTLRWQYWGHPQHHLKTPDVRKSFVDVSRIPMSLLHWKIDSHRPVPHDDVCPQYNGIHESSSMFVVHHYSGIVEKLSYGEHSTMGVHNVISHAGKLDQEKRLHKDEIHTTFFEGNSNSSIPQDWLEGFVNNVGKEDAIKLLKGVGH